LRGFLDSPLNQGFGTTQKPLAVIEAFTARVQAPVNDVHDHPSIGFSTRVPELVLQNRRFRSEVPAHHSGGAEASAWRHEHGVSFLQILIPLNRFVGA